MNRANWEKKTFAQLRRSDPQNAKSHTGKTAYLRQKVTRSVPLRASKNL